MELASPDRTIIRSFYTQYVGVMLILLTFLIGAMRIKPAQHEVIEPTQMVKPEIVGQYTLSEVFSQSGSLESGNEKLNAVVQVLKNHDLIGRFTLFLQPLSADQSETNLLRASIRLESLKRFLLDSGLPADAFKLIALPSGSDKYRNEGVTVDFIPTEGGV